jgi:hypothetical protein
MMWSWRVPCSSRLANGTSTSIPPEDEERRRRGNETLVQVVYEAIGSGARYRRRTRVRRDLKAERERWLILDEELPVKV